MCNSQNFEAFPKGKKAKRKYCTPGPLIFTVFFFLSPAEIVYSREHTIFKFKNKTKLEGILGMLTATCSFFLGIKVLKRLLRGFIFSILGNSLHFRCEQRNASRVFRSADLALHGSIL